MDDIQSMGIKDLRAVIERAGLTHADCFEKSDLRVRAAEAVTRLQECARMQAEARGTIVSAPSEDDDEPMLAPADEPEPIDYSDEERYGERVDVLLEQCGLNRCPSNLVADDVKALAIEAEIEFEDVPTTLARLEEDMLDADAPPPAVRRDPRVLALPPAGGPGALVPVDVDMYSKEEVLELLDDDVADMSARELKSIVLHAGKDLRGVVEKPELRRLAAQAQLAIKAQEAEEEDEDFVMGETVSEAERQRRAKAAAEASGGVHDLSDSDDSITDLTVMQSPKKKQKKDTDSKDAKKDVVKAKPSKQSHLNTLKTANDKLLQRVLWHLKADYFMKPHQPDAVRLVAGMGIKWPRDDRNGNYTAADLQNLLVTAPDFLEPRGLLLADVMGLGKTVESLLGAALRRGVLQAKKKPEGNLPTIIVGPNAAVLKQWREHLLGGIVDDEDEIFTYGGGAFFKRVERFHQKVTNGPAAWVLLTRYTLQSEIRGAYDSYVDTKGVRSPLFPNAGRLLQDLMMLYRVEGTGKKRSGEKNTLREKKEQPADTVRRIVANYFFGPQKGSAGSSNAVISIDSDDDEDMKPKLESKAIKGESKSGIKGGAGKFSPTALTVIIDEAHFLKNPVSLWGLAATLTGHSALRCVCATGTPYNNGPQDMAVLCSFWDASADASKRSWWVEVCKQQSGAKLQAAQNALTAWRGRGLLRRNKSVLAVLLPERAVGEDVITAALVEIYAYVPLQAAALQLIRVFAGLGDTGADGVKKRNLFKVLLSIWTLMRMCMVHSVLPRDGRELTKFWAPSRRKMKKIGKWPKDMCVVCRKSLAEAADDAQKHDVLGQGGEAKMPGGKKASQDAAEAAGGKTANDAIDLDGAAEANDADDDELDKQAKHSSPGVPAGEPLVPCQNCTLPGLGHMIHKCCAAKLLPGAPCPRCADLERRAQMGAGPLYCANIYQGFRASRKLEAAVQKVRDAVADGDAVVVWSFFKGSLDLAEAMLEGGEHGNAKISCIRFDGDVKADERSACLERFQKGEGDVLLATVHSGGTGLNVTRANVVVFLDRWFNPQVHEQAIDRCHRIGQTKDVEATFMDAQYTIDEVMRHVNTLKLDNSVVCLADQTQLGAAGQSIYKDVDGVIGKEMRRLADLLRATYHPSYNLAGPPGGGFGGGGGGGFGGGGGGFGGGPGTPPRGGDPFASDDEDNVATPQPSPYKSGQAPDPGCVIA